MSRPAVGGKCEACGDPAVRRVKYRGKIRRGCNRCTSRARQGGDFMLPWRRVIDRRQRILPRLKKLRKEGVTLLSAARRCRIARKTAYRWLEDERAAE